VTRTLEEVKREALTCTKCRLAAGRTQVVFGVGHPSSDLMFIGEAPGFHEDKQGEPFVGAAGQLLTTLLGDIGLTREQVYIANVLKCLRYNAPVQLSDGSWERIGRLVRSRYDGAVMAVDDLGRLVPRRVIGWYESPLGDRRVYRMTYASAKRAGSSRVSTQLTGDHEVLTQRGYVAVERLEPEDRVATGHGLSRLAFDVTCGSLLGDASIRGNNAYVSVSHSAGQEAYALYKAELLKELDPIVTSLKVSAVAGGDRSYDVVQIRTRARRAIRTLWSEFYRPRKRVPEWISERLNERMLAFWFMDDGHTRVRAGRQPIAEIATLGFNDEDLDILQEGLAGLGIRSSANRGRLHFDVRSTRMLSELIAPYVPATMRYKLHPLIARSIPFDPDRLVPGPAEVFYDLVEVQDITHLPRTDKTFFCIDVEETHNFVTAGGVVHNCRPPGNRDPMPDEIDSCKPWLKEQIDLIDPRVIATLGNFSTQLLLGRKVGITKVRGQRFDWRGRILIPTFHPAAVLRGGGAGLQMQQIGQDFAMIRKTLDEVPAPAEDPGEQLGLFSQ